MTLWSRSGDGIPLPLSQFEEWSEESSFANIEFHRVRRRLYDSLAAMARQGRAATKMGPNRIQLFALPYSSWQSIKSCLTSRPDAFTDEKKLAFDTTIADVLQAYDELNMSEDEFAEMKEAPWKGKEVPPPLTKADAVNLRKMFRPNDAQKAEREIKHGAKIRESEFEGYASPTKGAAKSKEVLASPLPRAARRAVAMPDELRQSGELSGEEQEEERDLLRRSQPPAPKAEESGRPEREAAE